MGPLVLVLLTILFALVLFFGVKVIDEEKSPTRAEYLVLFMIALTGFLTILFMTFISIKNDITPPTALDVYRGKTELQVNKIYKNDSIVSCDSIVIMKDNNLNSNE